LSSGSKKTKGPKQNSQNLGARKPMGLNRIAKIKGSKQDSQNLGARKSKGLNRIEKIWEQENQRDSIMFRLFVFLAPKI
jgi:hypothetical protein